MCAAACLGFLLFTLFSIFSSHRSIFRLFFIYFMDERDWRYIYRRCTGQNWKNKNEKENRLSTTITYRSSTPYIPSDWLLFPSIISSVNISRNMLSNFSKFQSDRFRMDRSSKWLKFVWKIINKIKRAILDDSFILFETILDFSPVQDKSKNYVPEQVRKISFHFIKIEFN